MSIKINRTIRTHWYADDLLKQCPSKGDKYVIDDELQHTDHLFLIYMFVYKLKSKEMH